MSLSVPEVLSLYRQVYRIAVKSFSRRGPASYQILDVMRNMFKDKSRVYDPVRFTNTLDMLRLVNTQSRAAKMCKNILRVIYHRQFRFERGRPRGYNKAVESAMYDNMYRDYNLTVRMAAESLNVYLPYKDLDLVITRARSLIVEKNQEQLKPKNKSRKKSSR
ncbi:hypothetical protein V1512DRAFT_256984 [Lipomyces arxii]|uniref:uncharacterized protein n=1 Tax=Lipomyces arxii TaxID=56418 RepID=UPI0034CE3C88